jgi:RNA polymerase sigma-70 factor, ECF subfamily
MTQRTGHLTKLLQGSDCRSTPPRRQRAMKTPETRSASVGDVAAQADARRQFDEVCTPFRADVFRFLYWLCHDRALAEDVMQETLLRAWRSFDSLENRKAAKSWLLAIARRELARGFERKRFETVDIDALTDADQGALAVQDSHEVHEMRRAILKLEPDYCEPLMLQVLFGYSTEEIAAHMELSVAAVLTRLFRARRLLRRHLLGEADEEEPHP